MNEQNKKVPTVRFKGFTNDWEQHKLGEISFKVNTKNKENLTLPVLSNSAEYGIVNQEDYFDKKIANRTDNYYIVKHNDFVYNPRISKKAPYGPIRRNTLDTKGLMSPLYYVFRINDGNYIYLDYYFKSSKWYKFMYQNGDSGARSDRFAIKDKIFQMMPISMPNTKEQNKIGQLIQTLQKLIDLQQRKLALLKQLKKGMLQKMFADKGSKRPILRFECFNDDWESVHLGNILKERNDKSQANDEYPLMSFVQGNGVTPKSTRYNREFLVKDSHKKYKKTELGDFIYSSNNLDTGSIGFNQTGKAVISPVYSIFYSKNNQESKLIGVLSQRKDFINKMIRYRQGVVYGQWKIHEQDFLNIKIRIPHDQEQVKIINEFNTLYQSLKVQKERLKLLNQLKKALLQQMFI